MLHKLKSHGSQHQADKVNRVSHSSPLGKENLVLSSGFFLVVLTHLRGDWPIGREHNGNFTASVSPFALLTLLYY